MKFLLIFASVSLFFANCDAGRNSAYWGSHGLGNSGGRPHYGSRPGRPSGSRYTVQSPTLSASSNAGLRFTYPADSGVTTVSVHYSVNQPVYGAGSTQHNVDIGLSQATGNIFEYEDNSFILKNGDIVYYWINVIQSGSSYQLTSQQWTVQSVPTADSNGCYTYPCLIFEDHFDTLNFDTWEHEITMSGGGNWEFQYYTNNRTNSYVKDGQLFIKPTLTADHFGEPFLSSGTLDLWGSAPPNLCTANSYFGCSRTGNSINYVNPVQSARLRSIHSFNVRYGKVEVEAQMPKGDWIWPAIWMLPQREAYGGWPASGEIDLVESRGNVDLKDATTGESKGNDMMGSTLHWGPYYPYNGYPKTTIEKHDDFAETMHKYGLEWDETALKLLLDDQVILTVDPGNDGFWKFGDFGLPASQNPWQYATSKMAPFDQPFYFILNVAVGGTNGFFPDSWTASPSKPWINTSPTAMKDFWGAKDDWYPSWKADVDNGEGAAMKVNYIKVWKTKADP